MPSKETASYVLSGLLTLAAIALFWFGKCNWEQLLILLGMAGLSVTYGLQRKDKP